MRLRSGSSGSAGMMWTSPESLCRAALLAGVLALSCGSGERAGARSIPPPDAGSHAVQASASQPGSVQCGAVTCTPHGIGTIVAFRACCPAVAPGHCGVDVSSGAAVAGVSMRCMELDAPGRVDASCRSLEMVTGPRGRVFPGCRKPSGKCGVHLAFGDVDLGCVETTGFVAQSTSAPPSSAAASAGAAPTAGTAPPKASGSPPSAPAPRKPDNPAPYRTAAATRWRRTSAATATRCST